jgi:peptide/nickel transport system ATP-binding protein
MSALPDPIPHVVLDVRGMSVAYGQTLVVSDVSLRALSGTIVGIAGESGSGKTTAVLAAMGYLQGGARRLSGEARLGNTALFDCDDSMLRKVWARQISYVPQDAVGSLNPAHKVGFLLREVLTVNRQVGRRDAAAQAIELLQSVGIPDPAGALAKYPHEFSGGQAQRIALALAFAAQPALLVLDEPTTGLDASTQIGVLATLRRMIANRDVAVLFVSHDLALLRAIADHLVIFYAGKVVESGRTEDLIERPLHPYTRGLVDALPSVEEGHRPRPLPGVPPGRVIADRCAFASRCRWAIAECSKTDPPLQDIDGRRAVRCIRQPALGVLPAPDAIAHPAADDRRPRGEPLLRMSGISFDYRRGGTSAAALREVSLQVAPHECVALVGESGSGKSTIARLAAGILRPRSGELTWNGMPLPSRPRSRSEEQRRGLQIIFQNPDSSLNPRHTISRLIERSFVLFRPDIPRAEYRRAVHEALREVHLDPLIADRFPDQLSGGQKQRVAIARALAARPSLVICDEIVSAQDVSVQAALIELLTGLQATYQMALLFISHDMAVVRSIADYIYVIRAGHIVEEGSTQAVFETPSDPYTVMLLNSVADGADAEDRTLTEDSQC